MTGLHASTPGRALREPGPVKIIPGGTAYQDRLALVCAVLESRRIKGVTPGAGKDRIRGHES